MITLRGNRSYSASEISWRKVDKELKSSQLLMVELFYMDSNMEVVNSDSRVELENLLHNEFLVVFTPLF